MVRRLCAVVAVVLRQLRQTKRLLRIATVNFKCATAAFAERLDLEERMHRLAAVVSAALFQP